MSVEFEVLVTPCKPNIMVLDISSYYQPKIVKLTYQTQYFAFGIVGLSWTIQAWVKLWLCSQKNAYSVNSAYFPKSEK